MTEQEGSINSISILGSGWLGFYVAQHLIDTGYSVKLSTTSPNRLLELASTMAQPYVVNISQIDDTIQEFLDSDILIINIPSKNSADYTQLLKQIEQSPVSKVLYASSTSVYPSANKVVDENDILDASHPKVSPFLVIENLIKECASIESTIVRFGGLIGYDRNPKNFFKNKPVRDPDSFVNLIHRDDCIEIIYQIIHQEAWGELFNACADSHPSKREFYTQVTQDAGMPLPVFENHSGTPYKIVSNERVKEMLDYSFKYPDLMDILQWPLH